jgi:tRNA dimethylallyltransferase
MTLQLGDKKPKIVAIVGPTASGKTKLAVKLALRLGSAQAKKLYGINGAEIVSADSRQIYKGMDIGTAKPLGGQISNFQFLISKQKSGFFSNGIRHYLIDIKSPNEDYTVAEYKKGAIAAIRKILHAGKLPFLVGGTGLYVKAVIDSLDIPKVKANKKLRARLEAELKQKGLGHLFNKLVGLDPEAAYIVDPKNPRRVIRALEIVLATGKPLSTQRKKGEPLFDALQIGIARPKGALCHVIATRVNKMLRDGLVYEVKNLVKKYGASQKAFDAIGYREIIDYLNGKITLPEATELMKKNTWRYAKRQMTWFRKDKDVRWIKNERVAEALVGKFLAR